MMRSCRTNPESETKSNRPKVKMQESIPGLEVAASSISWSSFLAEVSEVAALQILEISRSVGESTRSSSELNKETQVLLLPGDSGNDHSHFGQGLRRL